MVWRFCRNSAVVSAKLPLPQTKWNFGLKNLLKFLVKQPGKRYYKGKFLEEEILKCKMQNAKCKMKNVKCKM